MGEIKEPGKIIDYARFSREKRDKKQIERLTGKAADAPESLPPSDLETFRNEKEAKDIEAQKKVHPQINVLIEHANSNKEIDRISEESAGQMMADIVYNSQDESGELQRGLDALQQKIKRLRQSEYADYHYYIVFIKTVRQYGNLVKFFGEKSVVFKDVHEAAKANLAKRTNKEILLLLDGNQKEEWFANRDIFLALLAEIKSRGSAQ
jgi:hypothetical protein